MMKLLALIIASIAAMSASAAELPDESDIKFAIYSPAWSGNNIDDLRLIVHNQTGNRIQLDQILFPHGEDDAQSVALELELSIPPASYGESELPYVNLLQGDECVSRTLAGTWKLTEISNYTLNPSVRNLIIEDTDSFRIYQCVRTVLTSWTNLENGVENTDEEWVLYHFESRDN